MWSASRWNRSGDPFDESPEPEWDAVGRDGIGVGARIEMQTKPEAATVGKGALKAPQADLEVAQPAFVVRIELETLAVVGQEGALGEGEERRGRHDEG